MKFSVSLAALALRKVSGEFGAKLGETQTAQRPVVSEQPYVARYPPNHIPT